MNRDLQRDKAVVFSVALLVFMLHALAWPLAPGRDAATYFYYIYDFGNPHPEDWFTVMFRTPLAPLFDVFLIDVLGPKFAEGLMALFYAGAMTLLYAIAVPWGRRLAITFVILMFLHFGYASLFHVVSNDPPVTIVFICFLAAVLNAARNPSAKGFLFLGIAAAGVQMARPGIFGYVGILALVIGGITWRCRFRFLAMFLAGLLPWMLAWSYHNYLTYGVFQYSVGTEVFLPLGRLLAIDHLVKKENGPASRELAEILERTVLREEPYRGWDANTYFLREPHYAVYMALVDRELGRGHYRLLNSVGWEAVRANPVPYGFGVAKTFLAMMTGNLKLPVPLTNGAYVFTHKGIVAFQQNGHDTEVPLSEIDPHTVRPDPVSSEKAAKVGPNSLRAYLTTTKFPVRSGSIGLGRIWNWLAYVFPPMSLWILIAVLLGVFRPSYLRENSLRALLVIWALCVLTDFAASLGMWTQIYQYRLPFDPVFILLPLILGWNLAAEKGLIAKPDRV